MAQITTGVRAVLSHPAAYEFFQRLVGAGRFRRIIANTYILSGPHHRILDIGCGTGEVLHYLPTNVDYVGVDLSPHYITVARARHGDRGRFECGDVSTYRVENKGAFDVVLAFGILHHLDDEQARSLINVAWGSLATNGRLILIDPTFVEDQSLIARAIIQRDRGQHVRTPPEHVSFASRRFKTTRHTVRSDLLLIPYSHSIVEGVR